MAKDKGSSPWQTGASIGLGVASVGAGSFFKLLGTGANLLMQWAGLGAAERQADKQQAMITASQKSSDKLMQTQIAAGSTATKERLHHEKRQARRTWKWKEEEREYAQTQNAVNGFIGLLAADPIAKDRLTNTWNSARIR